MPNLLREIGYVAVFWLVYLAMKCILDIQLEWHSYILTGLVVTVVTMSAASFLLRKK